MKYLAAAACLVLAACSAPAAPSATETAASATLSTTAVATPSSSQNSSAPTRSASATQNNALGTVPPSWLGTRPLPTKDGTGQGIAIAQPTPPELRNRRFTLPDPLPTPTSNTFSATVVQAPDTVITRSTWDSGCPVAKGDLDYLTLTFWGFDNKPHTGELLLSHKASQQIIQVFKTLFEARFPIEQMQITTKAQLDARPTGDGNNTGAFACRPVRTSTVWSQHAYGLAVDVNPFQNPYHKGEIVIPELATSYLDRADVRPGMILRGGPVIAAFAAIGWKWGGNYRSLKDLQHFSLTGG